MIAVTLEKCVVRYALLENIRNFNFIDLQPLMRTPRVVYMMVKCIKKVKTFYQKTHAGDVFVRLDLEVK